MACHHGTAVRRKVTRSAAIYRLEFPQAVYWSLIKCNQARTPSLLQSCSHNTEQARLESFPNQTPYGPYRSEPGFDDNQTSHPVRLARKRQPFSYSAIQPAKHTSTSSLDDSAVAGTTTFPPPSPPHRPFGTVVPLRNFRLPYTPVVCAHFCNTEY